MSAERERETSGASAYTTVVANSLYGRSIWGRLRPRALSARGGAPADRQLVRRRPLYLIAALLIIVSVLTQYALLFVCGLLVLGIAVTPELWYRFGLRGLVVSREMESYRAAFGSIATDTLMAENRKLLPLPMVETEDDFPEQLTVLGMRLSLSNKPGSARLTRGLRLWTYQRVRRRHYVRIIQRGVYTLGPTIVRVTDPFGILTREQTFDTRRVLLAHPLVAPLDRFGLAPRAIFGDHTSRLRLLEDPLRVAGIREYVPGDDPRRVHWKATARLGALQSKLLDPSTQRTVIIALDVRTFNRAQMGYDPDLAELGIAAAASVAAWAMEHRYAVGLISNGVFSNLAPDHDGRPLPTPAGSGGLALPRLRVEPAAHPEQLTALLDSLARLVLFGGAPMGPLLVNEMRSAPAGAMVVYVGLESLVEVATLVALRRAQMSGHAVSLVLTKRDADDPFAEPDDGHDLRATSLPTYYIGGRSRWRALLTEALGELPPRQATDVPNDEHLAAERRLIAEQRQARVARHDHRKEEDSHAEPDEQRRDDDARQPAETPTAHALS